jgi:Skp family chaperone for outer membrane proteins
MRLLRAVMLALAAMSGPVPAQEQSASVEQLPLGQVKSPILIIDPERLFAESLFGQRLGKEVTAQSEQLAEENARIVAALDAEERSLTARRPGLPAEEFRAAAGAFDDRVQVIRAEQEAKARNLTQIVNRGREVFLNAATPVLAEIMRAAGAAVILDRRSVYLGVDAIDITDSAIAMIDARIGDGAALQESPGGPAPSQPQALGEGAEIPARPVPDGEANGAQTDEP